MSEDWLLKETLRYMGIHSSKCDECVQSLALKAIKRVDEHGSFRFVCDSYVIQVKEDCVVFGDHEIKSRDLAGRMYECKEAYILAATLGSDVDRLLSRDAILQPSLAVAEQAAATALIEQHCDEVCAELKSTLADGMSLLPRFSPGYGDCSLEEQSFCIDTLNASRRIGLTCTDSFILTPLKSVTAFVGVSMSPFCTSKGCAMCAKTDCLYRKV